MTQVAVYPGSFDPITLGHMDVIKRARVVFPKMIVAVAINPRKNPLFDAEERIELINASLTAEFGPKHGIRAEAFEGLLVNYMAKRKARVILRGLRALSDFEYEFQMTLNNRRLAEEVETYFLMTSEPYMSLSSGIIKEIAYFGGKIKGTVPPPVEKRLKQKLNQIRKENLYG